jgi:hypothetical protein
MTRCSDKLKAGDTPHKAGIYNNKQWGNAMYIKKRVGRAEEFIIVLGINSYT